ncbi:hypothetical protein Q3G72_024061 [Acer saccharum]|nr:hypothetical protein Q3G72_024061 [Acer saccharum]
MKGLKYAVIKSEYGENTENKFDPEKHIHEQRVSNLLQSIRVRMSLLDMPVIKKIPTSVLWGYFAYMDIDSLPGNQF